MILLFCHLISVFAENNDQVYVLLHRLLNLTKKNLQLNGNYEVTQRKKKRPFLPHDLLKN